MAGISREHLNRIEAGKVTLTDDMQDKLMEAVEKFNPDAPMFLLFDYVRIRFPTLDRRMENRLVRALVVVGCLLIITFKIMH